MLSSWLFTSPLLYQFFYFVKNFVHSYYFLNWCEVNVSNSKSDERLISFHKCKWLLSLLSNFKHRYNFMYEFQIYNQIFNLQRTNYCWSKSWHFMKKNLLTNVNTFSICKKFHDSSNALLNYFGWAAKMFVVGQVWHPWCRSYPVLLFWIASLNCCYLLFSGFCMRKIYKCNLNDYVSVVYIFSCTQTY